MKRGVLRSMATVSGMTLASRVLGFARQILIAGVIGAGGSPVADAFWAAFRLPNMFRRLFAEGAFHAAFIPLFQGKRTEGDAAARAFVEETLAGLVFLLTLLTAVVELAAPAFVFLLAGGFGEDPEKFALTTVYARIMFPYLFCMSLVGLFSGVLNAFGRFAASAGAPLILNGAMIAVLIAYADAPTARVGAALSWSVFAAGLLQLGLLYWGVVRNGGAPRLRLPRLSPDVKRLVALGLPGFVSAGALQFNLIIGTNIASREPGAVSWLINADQLYQLPLALIGIALASVLLPLFSAKVKAGDERGAVSALNRALEGSALLAFPAAVAFLVLGVPICEALYRGLASDALALFGGRGSAFTARDAAQTGAALALFGAGLPAFVWHKVLSPAYYAREDTKTPMRYALIAIAVNTVLALALFPLVGFLGVPLATSIAAWVQVALLAGGLSRSGGLALTARLVGRLARTAGASVALAAFLAACAPYTERYAALTFGREWVAVVLLCGAGLALYGLAALALGAVRLSDYKRATAT